MNGDGSRDGDAAGRRHGADAAALLVEAGRAFSESLDLDATLGSISSLIAGWFGDWCIIDLLTPDGRLERVEVAAADDADAAAADEMRGLRLDPQRPSLIGQVLHTRRPVLVHEVTDAHLEALAQNAEHLRLLRRLDATSYAGVPLLARDQLLGAMLIVRKHDVLADDELRTAEEIAGLAALAIVNARSYGTAQQALNARDSRLAIVAHDLRNPVAHVLFAAGLLELRLRQAGIEGLDHILTGITSAAESMRRMIDDLMDTVSLESGRLSMMQRPVAAARIVTDAVRAHEAAAMDAGIRLTASVGTGAASVYADPQRVEQVLSNLVGNSLKFTDSGGTVHIHAESDGDDVRFSVADSGCGIPEEFVHHVFEPFWRGADGPRRGLGIGLTIAREIVELHGGRITVRSRVGLGTTVSFTLPRLPDQLFSA